VVARQAGRQRSRGRSGRRRPGPDRHRPRRRRCRGVLPRAVREPRQHHHHRLAPAHRRSRSRSTATHRNSSPASNGRSPPAAPHRSNGSSQSPNDEAPARLHDERGSIAVEVAVIAPALVFLMLLVVYAGKVSEADGNVERAASDAARAASLRQDPGDATTDAQTPRPPTSPQRACPVSPSTTTSTPRLRPGRHRHRDRSLRGVDGRRHPPRRPGNAGPSPRPPPRSSTPTEELAAREPRDERGSITAFVAVVATALVLVAGMAYDGGQVIAAHNAARNDAERAARAGAQQIDLDHLRPPTNPPRPRRRRTAASTTSNASGATGTASVVTVPISP
jgi:Flp pilus assembly protein TadG